MLSGNRYLVVWLRSVLQTFGLTHVYARRVETDGTSPDAAPIPINVAELPNAGVTVGFDGTNHLVAWDVRTFDEDAGINIARVSPDGLLLDGPPLESGMRVASPPTFARLVAPEILFGAANTLLVWVVGIELSGEAKDVEGAMIWPF